MKYNINTCVFISVISPETKNCCVLCCCWVLLHRGPCVSTVAQNRQTKHWLFCVLREDETRGIPFVKICNLTT